MTPNLRFNKRMTKKMIQAMPREDERINKLSLEWNMANKNKIYGLENIGWFRVTVFLIQKVDDDLYRLIITNRDDSCNFYIIDDLDKFLEVVGIKELEYENPYLLLEALENTLDCPNTGIIVIDEEDKIYIYDHKNY